MLSLFVLTSNLPQPPPLISRGFCAALTANVDNLSDKLPAQFEASVEAIGERRRVRIAVLSQ